MTETITQQTTALDVIKAAYPARTYGVYEPSAAGITVLTNAIDVYSGQDFLGRSIDVLALPPASQMVALTADQWALMAGAANVWVQEGKLLYPDRYYASYDTSATQPTMVTGWYDTWRLQALSYAGQDGETVSVPSAEDMVAIASADWNNRATFRLPVGRGVKDGAVVDYVPPAPAVPLATQAARALSDGRAYVNANYTILNKPTPNAWVAYLTDLAAIADGADLTSTALPGSPISKAYTLKGPATAVAGSAVQLVLSPDGEGPESAVIVTLSDGDRGGTFSRPTVVLPGASAAPVTVNYTPKATGSVTVSATNNGSLTDPAAVALTVSAA